MGIPALAASQGVDNSSAPDFSEAVPIVDNSVTQHRAALLAHSYGAKPLQANLNVPTCVGSSVRGPVMTVLAALRRCEKTTTVDCTSTSTSYANDLEAFEIGFATLTPLYPPRNHAPPRPAFRGRAVIPLGSDRPSGQGTPSGHVGQMPGPRH